jgi:hypothetical protein
MRSQETAEQREARRVARVAKREAQQAQDEAAVAAALGEGWQVIKINKRYRLSPLRTASTSVTTMNWPTFEASSLDEAIAQAQTA